MPILHHKKSIVIIIFVIAILLRFYKIDSYPPLNADEAAIGYNAYSLLLTGKDEHGASWPLHFQSFGDYKPGGYFYLTMPFIKVLGLIPLAVRLPNLIFSIIALYFAYKLVELLTKNEILATISLAVIAINPWSIHFSRGGWESSTALSFIIIGTYFFFKYLDQSKLKNLILFSIFFSLSLYIYHSARIIAPLLALTYFINYKTYILNHRSHLFKVIAISFILITPVFISFIRNGGTSRFGGVGITADQGPIWRSNELLNQHYPLTLVDRLIHNKRTLYLLSWVQKYSSHFDLNFLFLTGDEVPRSKVPEMGQFYVFEVILLVLGLWQLFKNKLSKSYRNLILSWIVITPLASSLTFQAPSALRALALTVPFCLLIALGIYQLLQLKRLNILLLFILLLVYAYSLSYYVDAYFIHYLKRYPEAWPQNFEQITTLINQQKNKYQNIYVTNKYDQPYILYLFYSRYSPWLAQSQTKLTTPDQFGFSTVTQIGNIHFQKIDWNNLPKNSLVIAADEKVPQLPTTVINFSNNLPEFKIYTK